MNAASCGALLFCEHVKKVQDHYFKKAKKEGYPARSVYKLEEADKKYHILKKGDKVLDIGCQPGSWSMYAAKVVGPGGLVVGVDLNEGNIQGGGVKIHAIAGDILDPATVQQVHKIAEKFNAVISDMAPQTTGNKWTDQQQSLELARRALEVATEFLKAGGNFYCKVFEGEDFKGFVDSVREYFSKTKIVKPQSSRKESREVFVLGMEFLKNE